MSDRAGNEPRPLAELLSELTTELSTLVRQELQLAKVQLRSEAASAAKGSTALAVAALGALLTLVFGTSAAAWALAQLVATGWAFLIVTIFWLLVTPLAAAVGMRKLRQVGPPAQTVQSLKEDAQWVKTRKS